jgi:serine phosphatase RsbU (regulator of sigma subunit)
LTEIYKSLGEYEKAVASLEKMHHYKISFTNDSTVRVIADFQVEQAGRIKDLEHERVLENNAAEKRQLNTVIISLAVCLVIVSLSVFFIIRVLRIKYKANKELVLKNEILNRQKSEIEIQKAVITGQWQEVEEINHKLFNSIHYAKRIQGAAISPKTEVDALFPDNFIYYRPRDIVSGDYYRVAKCGRYNVFITADCTGHGIPGAFLSMLGISALKEYCVSEEDGANPGTVLDRMRSFIKSTLNSGSGKVIDDGMDMTICSFDFENMELRYAMANQTAYIIRKGEIIKLKGDRMPVGRYIVEKEHFTSYTLPLEKGDVVYTFSDGIPDQLGGELKSGMERKFLSKNLVAFLKEIYLKPFEEQNMLLDKEITAWRDGRPQVDDITLIGVRV